MEGAATATAGAAAAANINLIDLIQQGWYATRSARRLSARLTAPSNDPRQRAACGWQAEIKTETLRVLDTRKGAMLH